MNEWMNDIIWFKNVKFMLTASDIIQNLSHENWLIGFQFIFYELIKANQEPAQK